MSQLDFRLHSFLVTQLEKFQTPEPQGGWVLAAYAHQREGVGWFQVIKLVYFENQPMQNKNLLEKRPHPWWASAKALSSLASVSARWNGGHFQHWPQARHCAKLGGLQHHRRGGSMLWNLHVMQPPASPGGPFKMQIAGCPQTELPNLTNKHSGHPIKFEFQITNYHLI